MPGDRQRGGWEVHTVHIDAITALALRGWANREHIALPMLLQRIVRQALEAECERRRAGNRHNEGGHDD